MDSYSQQKIIKGVANHRRIEVLYLLASQPDLSVEEVSAECRVDYKTIAEHLRKLSTSGLISKNHYGRRVEHRLTERGKSVLKFLRELK